MKNSKKKRDELYGRQGDVGFIICAVPKESKRIKTRPFALGEVTGHSHRVAVGYEDSVEMYEAADGQVYVRIVGDVDVPVVHEDHDPTGTVSILPKGWEGRVVIAQEYDEEQGFRRVID